jgi:hypothetical protein
MSFLEKWKATLDSLEEQKLLQYLFLFVGVVFFVLLLLILYYFYVRSGWNSELEDLNSIRSSKVRMVLTKDQKLKQQEIEVNEMLAKDRDFLIGGYVEKVIKELNLLNKVVSSNVLATTEKSANYNEISIEIVLTGIDMKELVSLMQKFEENKRVYLKKLDIAKSKVMPKKLEVSMILATLLLK